MPTLVSVIVPCFNYGRFLDQCVESLNQQSYKNWECVIVDDGSTDNTSEICRRLAARDHRVRFIRQANAGLSAARNAGIRQARGTAVQLLDTDDRLEPRKLANQTDFLDQHQDVDIVLGDSAFFDEGRPQEVRTRRQDGGPGTTSPINGARETVLKSLVVGNVCVVNAALVRRAVFDTVGYFDESLRAHEDWEFWWRCALADMRFSFVSRGEDRALVREHDASMSRDRQLMFRTAITVRERVAASLPEDLRAENYEQMAQLKLALSIVLLRGGRAAEGWKLYKEAVRSTRSKGRALLRLLRVLIGPR